MANRAAQSLGRKGGRIGGKTTGAAKRRSPEQYAAIQALAVAARRVCYRYSARTSQQDGTWLEHVGTLRGAVSKAKLYARSAFPRSEYAGYGPTITVQDSDGQTLHEERL
jgi:hypothetical protein